MEYLYKIKDKLCRELEEMSEKSNFNGSDVEAMHILTDTIKNIDKIVMLEDGGYSQDDGYSRGSSYANRGKHYVRGHYSRDGYSRDGGYSSRRYSRDDAKSHMMNQLEEMMKSASSEREKDAILQCMDQLEKD